MKNKKMLPFGLWPSPITARSASQRTRLHDVQWNGSGNTLVICEGHGETGALAACPLDEARRELTIEYNVRGGVGYGGGEFNVSGDVLIFADRNGRLYRTSVESGLPVPLTPPFGKAASPVLSPDGRWVVYVYSDGVTDLLGLVDSRGQDWPIQLSRGADFYMQPAWHPDSTWLAWIEWNHPNMPWDGTHLMLGRMQGTPPHLVDVQDLAGDADTPVSQPQFSPDGRWLGYISGNGEWEDLVLYDLASQTRRVVFHGVDTMLSEPAWVQGQRSYGWSFSSQKLFCISNARGRVSLWEIPLDGTPHQINITPYTWLSQLSVSPVSDHLAFLASSFDVPDRVVRWNGRQLVTSARSDSESLAPDYFSRPEELDWKAADGSSVFGWFYPPTHPEFTCEGLPPCILYVHGGPTSVSPLTFSAQRTYFTSRGYAWLEINYRGSTGFGRSYMNALRQHWGEMDTEDAGNAALALARAGLADPQRLAILGGSAGGYLVLNALIRYPGRFKAAVCNYGVSNLFTLDLDTHKFEAYYTKSLVGALPEAAARYQDWSPVFHADRICDPLAVFQGSMDMVVPPAQSEEIVAALRQRGVPHLYRLYDGEGHGFRKAETLNDYYQQVERFLQQYVLFAPSNTP